MPELAVQKLLHLWERDAPQSRRKRKAAWKIARTGRDFKLPVLPPEEGEGDIANVAVVPVARELPKGPDIPTVDLTPADDDIVSSLPRGDKTEPDPPVRRASS